MKYSEKIEKKIAKLKAKIDTLSAELEYRKEFERKVNVALIPNPLILSLVWQKFLECKRRGILMKDYND